MNQPDTITSEVARLRAENARLREALEEIASDQDCDCAVVSDGTEDGRFVKCNNCIARAALEVKPHDKTRALRDRIRELEEELEKLNDMDPATRKRFLNQVWIPSREVERLVCEARRSGAEAALRWAFDDIARVEINGLSVLRESAKESFVQRGMKAVCGEPTTKGETK